MTIAENIKRLRLSLPREVTLVAVSKFQTVSLVREAYEAGQHIFGENRSQELLEKIPVLPHDIQWHFIGHLQTNKVKDVVGKAVLIQSVDRTRLLRAIDLQAEKLGIVQDVLLQVHIASEDTKHGYSPKEVLEIQKEAWTHVRVCGLMGMASFTEDKSLVRSEFQTLRTLFDTLKTGPFADEPAFVHCSMGMTQDYTVALEEGSTMVRIGSAIFPPRLTTLSFPEKP
ncbi:MAG: YggS family pyridoxal phosphate-dependent enzyme [Bacteroidales bacterium]|jgi:pyridoxal phosphate enzyme (YggS family)|nr:YggS family pyridoxal phosphate-dependent enzyme [Bacteroidales bacterium]NLK79862.1 YggS family pyridoxal phosphate-dependent enzyme [Bacteroidales bacterium]HPX79500.1 YggS family pyridoxal phosphate-dependent enzyme [Bacteroidales bacterium]